MNCYQHTENIDALIGKTLSSVTQRNKEELIFVTDENIKYKMYHEQDCCESVYIEDICGDLDDLVGSPIVEAEEVSNKSEEVDSYTYQTWTFYKLGTAKGNVTIRWLGTSNGYYSERVDFVRLED